MGKCWKLVSTIALKKVSWAREFVKVSYWVPKEQNGSRVAKIALRGPKSESLLYLSNYDSVRPENWQILISNWYNSFRKGFVGYGFRQNGLLGTKWAKNRRIKAQNIVKTLKSNFISAHTTLWGAKISKCWAMIVTVNWMFTKLVLIVPKSSEYFLMFGH